MIHKNCLISLLCLFFAFLSCSKHDYGGDCRDISFSEDRRQLIGPQWMVHLFDSLENHVIDLQQSWDFSAWSIEYKQNTYITICQSMGSICFYGPFFKCSGEKVIPGIFFPTDIPQHPYDDPDPLYQGLLNAISEGNYQQLFTVHFCYFRAPNCYPRYGTTYR